MYEIFKAFKAYVEKFSGKNIKVLRSDNGKECFNNNLQYLHEENDIKMHSVPYTPQKNGVAERKIRALKEMATCMLEACYLYPKLWDGEINYVAYV